MMAHRRPENYDNNFLCLLYVRKLRGPYFYGRQIEAVIEKMC